MIAAAALLALVLFLGAPAPASGQACPPVGYGNPPVGASISAPAEVDCFTVAAGAGDRLQLTIAETSAGFTAFSAIRRPDGSTLCASAASPQVCVVDTAGTHTVLVRDQNSTATGSYALSVQRLNGPVGCTPLAYGGAPVAGATSAAADVDCFTFAGAAGERVQVTVGRVLAVNATVVVGGYPGGAAQFRHQIVTTAMSAGGDSGSLLMDQNLSAIGLLFAGSPFITIHNHIANVESALGVRPLTAPRFG